MPQSVELLSKLKKYFPDINVGFASPIEAANEIARVISAGSTSKEEFI